MADSAGRDSGTYFAHRMQSDPRNIAAPTSSQTQSSTDSHSRDRAPKAGSDFTVHAERRASRRPKVSVMVITYNHAKYIAQALESVLMQETNFDFEINVIEDCSTDGTQEIVMRYVRKYPHIVKPYFNQKNIGFKVTQKNFYRGFKTLTGDYLAILEGDDYWTSPYKLQKQVDFLDANPAFAICAHNTMSKMYEDGSNEPHRPSTGDSFGDSTVEDTSSACACSSIQRAYCTVMSSRAFRRATIAANGHTHTSIHHDLLACDSSGKVHHIDEDMAVYRAHAGGRFSGMKALDGWLFNIDGLRRYNAWLGYRYLRTFSESISAYCEHVLRSHGKEASSRR